MASSSKAPAANTPSEMAIKRLSRDIKRMKEEPIEGIDAMPLEENILEWHYVLRGSMGTDFEGGLYHGKLVFPSEFPWKPPSIYMFTPNGRFFPNMRLCLSISDYHPETWNPAWTVSSILVGLHSFMNDSVVAMGTENTTPEKKRELAGKSASYNLRDATFCKLFPALVAEIEATGVAVMSDAQAQEEMARVLGPMEQQRAEARQRAIERQQRMAAMQAAGMLPNDARVGPGMAPQQPVGAAAQQGPPAATVAAMQRNMDAMRAAMRERRPLPPNSAHAGPGMAAQPVGAAAAAAGQQNVRREGVNDEARAAREAAIAPLYALASRERPFGPSAFATAQQRAMNMRNQMEAMRAAGPPYPRAGSGMAPQQRQQPVGAAVLAAMQPDIDAMRAAMRERRPPMPPNFAHTGPGLALQQGQQQSVGAAAQQDPVAAAAAAMHREIDAMRAAMRDGMPLPPNFAHTGPGMTAQHGQQSVGPAAQQGPAAAAALPQLNLLDEMNGEARVAVVAPQYARDPNERAVFLQRMMIDQQITQHEMDRAAMRARGMPPNAPRPRLPDDVYGVRRPVPGMGLQQPLHPVRAAAATAVAVPDYLSARPNPFALEDLNGDARAAPVAPLYAHPFLLDGVYGARRVGPGMNLQLPVGAAAQQGPAAAAAAAMPDYLAAEANPWLRVDPVQGLRQLHRQAPPPATAAQQELPELHLETPTPVPRPRRRAAGGQDEAPPPKRPTDEATSD